MTIKRETFFIQIDHNHEFILTRHVNDFTYSSEATFSWDNATKLDFMAPQGSEIAFKIGNSMPNWFFRDPPDQRKGFPRGKGIHFPNGVKKGAPRSKKEGSFDFISQTAKELVIEFIAAEKDYPKRNEDGYLKFELYLSNKQINNEGEIAELLYTIDPGGGGGKSTP